ncbi:hypothetical protein TrRE_jg9508, partial [Triparma retinervis]
ITFEVGCAALCCASAQACLEAFYGTGDEVRMKEKCFEIYERMESECKGELQRMKGTNHFNCDRMALGMIKACDAAGDTEGSISALLNSRFSSTTGEHMNDWDYLNFKSLAVASVLRSAKSNEFDLARAELVASQVCGGSEVDVLLSSFRTLSVYLRTLNALGMHDKAVATFTDAEDRNWDYQSEDEEGWHSCVCEAVTALGKSGRAQDAWDLVKDVDRRHLSTDIFESLGDAYEAGDSPEGVVQVFRFADREGMATDHLVRKAILAYTTMNKHENVILHAKMLGARRKKGGRLIAGVSARERRGKKRLEDSDYGWWSSLVGARAWAMGEGQEKDDVLYAIVKAARKVEFEKFLMYVVKTAAAAEKEGKSKPLEGRTLAAAIDTCGFNVRRRGKGGCRGEPVADFERDFKEAEWDERVKKGRRNLKKVLDVAESWGLTTDDSVMASASRAWRALGKPYHNYDIIKKSMKSQ